MAPVRVIGRIDLAERVHRLLLEAGVDARLATASPGWVIGQTATDDSALDVVAFDADALQICARIKRRAPTRPVVVLTTAPIAEAAARGAAAGASGPDASAGWPCTGAELVDACERARACAVVPRPRFTRADLPAMATVALLGLAFAAYVALYVLAFVRPGGVGPLLSIAHRALAVGFPAALAVWFWTDARFSRYPRLQRGVALVWLGQAALALS